MLKKKKKKKQTRFQSLTLPTLKYASLSLTQPLTLPSQSGWPVESETTEVSAAWDFPADRAFQIRRKTANKDAPMYIKPVNNCVCKYGWFPEVRSSRPIASPTALGCHMLVYVSDERPKEITYMLLEERKLAT